MGFFLEDKDAEAVDSTEMGESTVNEVQEIAPVEGTCFQCSAEQSCIFKFMKNNEVKYLCALKCLNTFLGDNPQYVVMHKKYLIVEIEPNNLTCSECEEFKLCYFYYNYDGEDTNYCSLECLHSMMADEKEKYSFKRRRIFVEEIETVEAVCTQCNEKRNCIYKFIRYGITNFICSMPCVKDLNEAENRFRIRRKKTQRWEAPKEASKEPPAQTNPPLLKLKVISNATDKYLDEAYKIQSKTPSMIQAARDERERSFIRSCTHCHMVLNLDDKNLSWETMDFCNEGCLGRYQNKIGSKCANCKNLVTHTSLGKYCVRFGYDIRQFCNSGCLEEFKKGLKICCYCQRDISTGHQGFLAPVGDKGQFKDFCSQLCMEKFDQMSKNPVPQPMWAKCAVCSLEKLTTIEVGVNEVTSQRLCSEPCFAAFKFVNSICPGTFSLLMYSVTLFPNYVTCEIIS